MRSLHGAPDPFLGEICGQPAALRRAAGRFLEDRAGLESIHDRAAAARTIVFTGMGSSYDACYPAVNDLAGRGVPALLVDSAELLHFRRAILGPETLLVIVSQSGESAEIVKLAKEIERQKRRPFLVSITNGTGNDLARAADVRLDRKSTRLNSSHT